LELCDSRGFLGLEGATVAFEPSRRKSLLEHFSAVKDTRQRCKVMHQLDEMLLLVVCGTICGCDDYDDIVLWGETHLEHGDF
jgi:hypothetical protein